MKVRTVLAFGDLVHERRVDLGWSQDRLAEEMGASRAWVNRFESGRGTAQLQLVLNALDALGLSVDIAESADA